MTNIVNPTENFCQELKDSNQKTSTLQYGKYEKKKKWKKE